MQNFQGTFETRKRSFISAFSICGAVHLRETCSPKNKLINTFVQYRCMRCKVPSCWERKSVLWGSFKRSVMLQVKCGKCMINMVRYCKCICFNPT